MVDQVNWDEAPPGATHFNNVNCRWPWLKRDDTGYYFYYEPLNRWFEYPNRRLAHEYYFDNAIKRHVDDGWIEWKGGNNPPVNPDVKVLIVKRNGASELIPWLAGDYRWDHRNEADIVKYKVVKDDD